MKKIFLTLFLLPMLLSSILVGVEVAPRITDREIVERLTRLEEGQKSLEKRIDALEISLNKRIDDLRSEMNSRF